MVELRINRRERVTFTVSLQHGGGGLISCQARNLSVEGMLLELDHQVLPIGDPISLYVQMQGCWLEMSAVIQSSNESCMRVKFDKPQPEFYRLATQPENCRPVKTAPAGSASNSWACGVR